MSLALLAPSCSLTGVSLSGLCVGTIETSVDVHLEELMSTQLPRRDRTRCCGPDSVGGCLGLWALQGGLKNDVILLLFTFPTVSQSSLGFVVPAVVLMDYKCLLSHR